MMTFYDFIDSNKIAALYIILAFVFLLLLFILLLKRKKKPQYDAMAKSDSKIINFDQSDLVMDEELFRVAQRYLLTFSKRSSYSYFSKTLILAKSYSMRYERLVEASDGKDARELLPEIKQLLSIVSEYDKDGAPKYLAQNPANEFFALYQSLMNRLFKMVRRKSKGKRSLYMLSQEKLEEQIEKMKQTFIGCFSDSTRSIMLISNYARALRENHDGVVKSQGVTFDDFRFLTQSFLTGMHIVTNPVLGIYTGTRAVAAFRRSSEKKQKVLGEYIQAFDNLSQAIGELPKRIESDSQRFLQEMSNFSDAIYRNALKEVFLDLRNNGEKLIKFVEFEVSELKEITSKEEEEYKKLVDQEKIFNTVALGVDLISQLISAFTK